MDYRLTGDEKFTITNEELGWDILDFDDHSNYNELMNQTVDVAVKLRDVFKKYL